MHEWQKQIKVITRYCAQSTRMWEIQWDVLDNWMRQEQFTVMCSFCIISVTGGHVWATLPESFNTMKWMAGNIAVHLVRYFFFSPGFRNDFKGSPEGERWYCCTNNRAAQAVQWTELASWKDWPAIMHPVPDDDGVQSHRLATERCCYNHTSCCMFPPWRDWRFNYLYCLLQGTQWQAGVDGSVCLHVS